MKLRTRVQLLAAVLIVAMGVVLIPGVSFGSDVPTDDGAECPGSCQQPGPLCCSKDGSDWYGWRKDTELDTF